MCFTGSPWREPYPKARSVAARVLADSERPGFVLALAVAGDEVYGFAYGHRCSALAGCPPIRPPRPRSAYAGGEAGEPSP
ncbi:hypothetical protein ACIBH1_43055 [Nonomuraea sp. NPDC050663]|uniref:hypothetical protein n=1 Tax=Nonomuraea sp. NPDC050663 TaxID=3364370 RepID=UPI0037B53910